MCGRCREVSEKGGKENVRERDARGRDKRIMDIVEGERMCTSKRGRGERERERGRKI